MYLVLILKKTNVPLTNHTDANTENRRVLENIYIADRKKKSQLGMMFTKLSHQKGKTLTLCFHVQFQEFSISANTQYKLQISQCCFYYSL